MFRKSSTADAAMRDRTRSQVVAQSALETIREQKGQLVNGGLSRLSFFTGVANSLLIAFVVGKFPEYYWLLHLVEAAVLMPIHTAHLCRIKRGLAILEVCWVTNYVLFALLCYTVLALVAPTFTISFASDSVVLHGWYIFFMLGVGPLGSAIVATNNALVFHNFHSTTALFIHLSPLLTAWCIRGDYGAFRAAFPTLLAGIETHDAHALYDLLLPAIGYYLAWWVPYGAWLLIDGISQPERGNGTVYQPFEAIVYKAVPATSSKPRAAACVYLVGHLIGVCFTYSLALGCYYSYYFFSVYVAAMVLSAVWQGSAKYNYYLLDLYEKKVATAVETGVVIRGSMALV